MFGLFDIKAFYSSSGTVLWQLTAFNPKNGIWLTKSWDIKPTTTDCSQFLKSIDPDITFLSL